MTLHLLPWHAARIYQIVAHKELPIPAQQRRIMACTSAYEKQLAQLWEDAKAKLRNGEWTPEEFAQQMGDLADGAFLPAIAEILGIDESELTPAMREMATTMATENRGFIQSSLLPDIVKAASDPSTYLGLFDYRIAALYGGALHHLGTLATVTFDGVSLRDLGDLFLFAGPKDDRTCGGARGCDQYVGEVYPVAYILGQKIIPGTLACLHNCRHILIPIASLPEKARPKPSAVHSDIEHVYGAEKHLPGKHDQMAHGSWARTTPEGGKREPKFAVGHIANEQGYEIASLDYASRSGAQAWLKKQPNAKELQVLYGADGMYYVIAKPKATGDTQIGANQPHSAISPALPDGMTNDEKTAQQTAICTHFNAGETSTKPLGVNTSDDASASAKIQVEHRLEDATGESSQDCREAIRSWSGSSNDTRLPSLAMQEAVEEELGSKRTQWQKFRMEETIGERNRRSDARDIWDDDSYPFEQTTTSKEDWPGDSKPRTKAFVRAQYERTQAELKAAGITHVVVYRGTGKLRDQDGFVIEAKNGDYVPYRGNAMESWSLVRMNPGAGKFGSTIVRAVVPVDRILSTPRTGFGCLHEYEVVVLGGVGAGDIVEVQNQ